MLSAADSERVERLLGAYAATVDDRDWQGWLELFDSECSYLVYSQENHEENLPLGYMIDDCRGRLEDRVKFMTQVWVGTVEPYQTRHIIQRVGVERVDDNLVRVRSNLIVTYSEKHGPSGILVSGYYDDVIRLTGSEVRFTSKTVYLDGTPARYLGYPI